MYRCVRCLHVGSAGDQSGCVSCSWRATRQQVRAVAQQPSLDGSRAWRLFRGCLQPADARLQRLRMLALLVGEDGHAVEMSAGAALLAGDAGPYQAELLRLAEKLLDRIDEL